MDTETPIITARDADWDWVPPRHTASRAMQVAIEGLSWILAAGFLVVAGASAGIAGLVAFAAAINLLG